MSLLTRMNLVTFRDYVYPGAYSGAYPKNELDYYLAGQSFWSEAHVVGKYETNDGGRTSKMVLDNSLSADCNYLSLHDCRTRRKDLNVAPLWLRRFLDSNCSNWCSPGRDGNAVGGRIVESCCTRNSDWNGAAVGPDSASFRHLVDHNSNCCCCHGNSCLLAVGNSGEFGHSHNCERCCFE